MMDYTAFLTTAQQAHSGPLKRSDAKQQARRAAKRDWRRLAERGEIARSARQRSFVPLITSRSEELRAIDHQPLRGASSR